VKHHVGARLKRCKGHAAGATCYVLTRLADLHRCLRWLVPAYFGFFRPTLSFGSPAWPAGAGTFGQFEMNFLLGVEMLPIGRRVAYVKPQK